MAKNALFPLNDYEAFLSAKNYSKRAIEDFAMQVGIHPGIVVGRLQSEKIIPFSQFNEMKLRYSL